MGETGHLVRLDHRSGTVQDDAQRLPLPSGVAMSIHQGLEACSAEMAHRSEIDDDRCVGRGLERHVHRVSQPDDCSGVDLPADRYHHRTRVRMNAYLSCALLLNWDSIAISVQISVAHPGNPQKDADIRARSSPSGLAVQPQGQDPQQLQQPVPHYDDHTGSASTSRNASTNLTATGSHEAAQGFDSTRLRERSIAVDLPAVTPALFPAPRPIAQPPCAGPHGARLGQVVERPRVAPPRADGRSGSHRDGSPDRVSTVGARAGHRHGRSQRNIRAEAA